MNPNLGFIPLIPIAVKALPAVVSILTGKKKKKAAERMAQYEASSQQIAAGQAVMATDVMTEADKAFLRKVWPSIHVAASFKDPNWAAHGYPAGPALTPAALAAITHVWPQVNSAANFDDVNWQYHAVPLEVVGALLPLPELGYQTPAPQLPQYQTGSGLPGYQPSPGYAPSNLLPLDPYAPRGASQASLLPGGLSPTTVAVVAGLAVVGLIIARRR